MVTNRVDRLAVAVRALLVLVTAPRGMATSAELADSIGAHPVVLRRLLGLLRAEGIVESRRGVAGGWAIARDPAHVTLGRVLRVLGDDPTAAAPDALDEALERARGAYLAQLDTVTLASLMGARAHS